MGTRLTTHMLQRLAGSMTPTLPQIEHCVAKGKHALTNSRDEHSTNWLPHRDSPIQTDRKLSFQTNRSNSTIMRSAGMLQRCATALEPWPLPVRHCRQANAAGHVCSQPDQHLETSKTVSGIKT